MLHLKPDLNIRIAGAGLALPAGRTWSNIDLLKRHPDTAAKSERLHEEFAKKIELVYGPKTRHFSHFPGEEFRDDEETSESLALRASSHALEAARGVTPEFLILGSTSSCRYSGSQAAAVSGKLGLECPAYETKSGCSTTLFSLQMAIALFSMGCRSGVVTCAETLSKVIDPKNREAWFGFADGGAAVVIEKIGDETTGDNRGVFRVEQICSSTEGQYVDLYTTRGQMPPRKAALEQGLYYIGGDAQEIKDLAVERYLKMIRALLPTAAARKGIRWILTHQVNRQITDFVVGAAELSGEVIWSARDIGNIGGASILYTLSDCIEKNLFRSGDRILLMSVGGGLSYAAQVWEKA